jgi:prepilin-type N-terminal cleavage/methylation domain-containing protein
MNQEGFSLIELLIVVAIIGVVSAIAMPNLLNARKAAYEANAVRYLKTWLPGQEMYKKVNGSYATNDEDLVTGNFISKSLNSGGNADDTAFLYSIDSSVSDDPQWWGKARRRSALVATRSFYIDQTGVIRARIGNDAFATDQPIE